MVDYWFSGAVYARVYADIITTLSYQHAGLGHPANQSLLHDNDNAVFADKGYGVAKMLEFDEVSMENLGT